MARWRTNISCPYPWPWPELPYEQRWDQQDSGPGLLLLQADTPYTWAADHSDFSVHNDGR